MPLVWSLRHPTLCISVQPLTKRHCRKAAPASLIWFSHPTSYVSVHLLSERSCRWVALPFEGIKSARTCLCRSSPMNKGTLLWRSALYQNKVLGTWEKLNCKGFVGKHSLLNCRCWWHSLSGGVKFPCIAKWGRIHPMKRFDMISISSCFACAVTFLEILCFKMFLKLFLRLDFKWKSTQWL